MSAEPDKVKGQPVPVVSVIIPVYNGERYLAEAIESVLGQTYSQTEIIALDDGSTDDSAALAGRYKDSIIYHYQPNAGLAAALNKGVEISRGSFLSFLDADDVWTPRKLERQMTAMEDPEIDMVFGHIEQFYSPELNKPSGAIGSIPGYSKGTLLIRRQSFLRVGAFSKQFQLGDFIEWYLRAAELGLKSLMLKDVVMRRRIHTGNMGVMQRGHRADYLRILKASLDRRRTVQSGDHDPSFGKEG